jgi:hypothetical protein
LISKKNHVAIVRMQAFFFLSILFFQQTMLAGIAGQGPGTTSTAAGTSASTESVVAKAPAIAGEAKPPTTAPAEKWLRAPGTIRSGVADQYMSLLDIRRSASKTLKTERLIVDWGDRFQSIAEKGGYYQVEYQQNPPRVVIAFSLTLNTHFENRDLLEKFQNSLYIEKVGLDFDFLGQSQILTFSLKKPVAVRVVEYTGNEKKKIPAKLLVDLVASQ